MNNSFKKHNPSILFLLKAFEVGGLEVVTAVLANKFAAEGHNVSIFAFGKAEHSIADRLDPRIHTCVMHELTCNNENTEALRRMMQEQKVDVVINQWGLPLFLLKTAKKAGEGMDIKYISVYHNTPDMNGRIQTVQQELDATNNQLKHLALKAKFKLFKAVTAACMRYNYKHSDRYMVLSPSFVEKFEQYTGIKRASKLLVQTNPVTVDATGYTYAPAKKRKEVVYMGRLDYMQKRTLRLLKAWALVEKKCADWQLTIVGVGPDGDDMKAKAEAMGLQHVSFEGYQQPRPYYERASILALTSEFEGFPLVLAECMSFGVVPVVYNSYAAAGDIVNSGENGVLVEKQEGKFDAENFANTLLYLMNNKEKLNAMAKEAVKTAENYSADAIYEQWKKVFDSL